MGEEKPEDRVPGRPITDKGIVRRAKKILPEPGPKSVHNRYALILEWSKTDPGQFQNVSQWIKATHPEIHPGTLQSWGGKTLWNRFRDSFRAEAFSRALVKAQEIPERNFGRIIKAQEGIVSAMEKVIARLHKELDQEDLKTGDPSKDFKFLREKTVFYAAILERLKEVQLTMAEVERIMLGGLPRPEIGSVNLVQAIVQQVKERNERLNVHD